MNETKKAPRMIAHAWANYRRTFIPQDFPADQLERERQAFYTGAALVWQVVMLSMSEESIETPDEMAILKDFQLECDEHGADMDRRHLSTGRTS